MSRSDLVDIMLIRVREAPSGKAWGFKETEDSEGLVWLPKSLIEMEPTKKEGIFVVTMPEYLAHEKELI
ncbi:MAG TPA: hypothetical protein VF944_04515 [Candidatus Bathyarchaeia archaeon]